MTFTVFVDDNGHYRDEPARYRKGDYATWDEAVTICREMVDDYLASAHRPGMSADDLFRNYTAFGEDPFVVPVPDGLAWSSWDYARARCDEICDAK